MALVLLLAWSKWELRPRLSVEQAGNSPAIGHYLSMSIPYLERLAYHSMQLTFWSITMENHLPRLSYSFWWAAASEGMFGVLVICSFSDERRSKIPVRNKSRPSTYILFQFMIWRVCVFVSQILQGGCRITSFIITLTSAKKCLPDLLGFLFRFAYIITCSAVYKILKPSLKIFI